MNADDEHFLVVRAVKNDDFAALREVASGAPKEIVPKLRRTRVAVAKDIAALWVDAGHHVLNAAVLSGCIHGLEDNEHSMPVRGVEQLLQGTQAADVFIKKLLVLLFRAVHWIDPRRPTLEVNGLAALDEEFFCDFFHD